MRKCLVLLTALLLTACNSDSDTNGDPNTGTGGSGDKNYSAKTLGPTTLNNTVTVAFMVTPNDTTESVTANPTVNFDQKSGQLTIAQGTGIRSAEATFLLTNEQTLDITSCGHLEALTQSDSGCLLTVSASDLNQVYLSGVQLFDQHGNLINTAIQ